MIRVRGCEKCVEFGKRCLMYMVVVMVLVCLITLLYACQSGGTQQDSQTNQTDSLMSKTSDTSQKQSAYSNLQQVSALGDFPCTTLVPSNLDEMPNSETPAGFCLSAGSNNSSSSVPTLSVESQSAINQALTAIAEQDSRAGFLFMSLENGTGFVYNVDDSFYSASTIKGPYANYLCSYVLDQGLANRSDWVSYVSDSVKAFSYRGSGTFESMLEDSIVNSDNAAFGGLYEKYASLGWEEYLSACDIREGEIDFSYTGGWYPSVSVRGMAKLWLQNTCYLQAGSENAQWLAGLFESTGTSFIRNALVVYDGVQVLDKAGWNADGDYAYNAIADCGIVISESHPYLMVVLTDFAHEEKTQVLVEDLARALFDARVDL